MINAIICNTARTAIIYASLTLALVAPVFIASTSPLLEWRQPVYILAGMAGVIGLCLLLLQPLLASQVLPGLGTRRAIGLHRLVGIVLVSAVAVHITGLWITSPPDVIDALLFRSPTPFAAWGVVAMWAVMGAAILAALRVRVVRRIGWRRGLRIWRWCHTSLAVITVAGTVAHALMIDGTMGLLSKWALCLMVVGATIWLMVWQRARPGGEVKSEINGIGN